MGIRLSGELAGAKDVHVLFERSSARLESISEEQSFEGLRFAKENIHKGPTRFFQTRLDLP